MYTNDKASIHSLNFNISIQYNKENSDKNKVSDSNALSETRENVEIDTAIVRESNIIREKADDKGSVVNFEAKIENSKLQQQPYEITNSQEQKGQQIVDPSNQLEQENINNEQRANEEASQLNDNTKINKNRDETKAQPISKANNDQSSTALDIVSSYGLFIAAGCISISVMGVLIYLYTTRRKAIGAVRFRYRLVSNLEDESFDNEPIDMDI